MAFTPVETKENVVGVVRRINGTFSDGAPTAAEIKTVLSEVYYAELTGASAISVSGGTMTVTSAATSGFWTMEGV